MNTQLLEKAGAFTDVLEQDISIHGVTPDQFAATAAEKAAELERVHGQTIPGLAAAIEEAYREIWGGLQSK